MCPELYLFCHSILRFRDVWIFKVGYLVGIYSSNFQLLTGVDLFFIDDLNRMIDTFEETGLIEEKFYFIEIGFLVHKNNNIGKRNHS